MFRVFKMTLEESNENKINNTTKNGNEIESVSYLNKTFTGDNVENDMKMKEFKSNDGYKLRFTFLLIN